MERGWGEWSMTLQLSFKWQGLGNKSTLIKPTIKVLATFRQQKHNTDISIPFKLMDERAMRFCKNCSDE